MLQRMLNWRRRNYIVIDVKKSKTPIVMLNSVRDRILSHEKGNGIISEGEYD